MSRSMKTINLCMDLLKLMVTVEACQLVGYGKQDLAHYALATSRTTKNVVLAACICMSFLEYYKTGFSRSIILS